MVEVRGEFDGLKKVNRHLLVNSRIITSQGVLRKHMAKDREGPSVEGVKDISGTARRKTTVIQKKDGRLMMGDAMKRRLGQKVKKVLGTKEIPIWGERRR